MKKIEIYIHIPFCVRKCHYCDFLSGVSDHRTRSQYVDALCQEIIDSKERLKDYLVTSVFFGGGTPSMLTKEEITQIMSALKEVALFTEDCEITIECNPGAIEPDLFMTYKAIGINRISFGLQSTNDKELQLLGRIHTYQQFLENYELARKIGFDNINIDLMSALPNQTLEQYEETVRKVVALQPEHISAYSLIIEDGTPFGFIYGENGTRQDELPSVEVDRLMYERTKEILLENGYERYEISNYAKCGFECRHNVGYWQRVEYLGFGLGAASLYKGQRFHNEKDMKTYLSCIEQGETVWREIETQTKNSAIEEYMFLGLRMCSGISISNFEQLFGVSMMEVYGQKINRFIQEKVLERDGDLLRLTEYGLDVSNAVFAEFLL